MDLKKAQRLIHKIESFLSNGNEHEWSRLEKDLVKSYILQLYDTITDEQENSVKHSTVPLEYTEYKEPKKEAVLKSEIAPKKQDDFYASENRFEDKKIPEEKPVEYETKKPEYRPPVVEEKKPVAPDPVEPIHSFGQQKQNFSPDLNDALTKIFDIVKKDEASGRISHVPISSIESAMGLNERIFTLNDLFGGNKALFDATCSKLNHLQSFEEAQALLLSGPAAEFKWSSPDKIKMAEHFIRIVSRRYPKSAS